MAKTGWSISFGKLLPSDGELFGNDEVGIGYVSSLAELGICKGISLEVGHDVDNGGVLLGSCWWSISSVAFSDSLPAL